MGGDKQSKPFQTISSRTSQLFFEDYTIIRLIRDLNYSMSSEELSPGSCCLPPGGRTKAGSRVWSLPPTHGRSPTPLPMTTLLPWQQHASTKPELQTVESSSNTPILPSHPPQWTALFWPFARTHYRG